MSFKTYKASDPGVDRRTFMCKSACASLGVTGIANSLAHLRLMQAAMGNQGTIDDDDYKALVVVFMFGGNDSYNMMVPASANAGGITHPDRSAYEGLRRGSGSGLGLVLTDWNDANPAGGNRNFDPILPIVDPVSNYTYGLHPRFGRDFGTASGAKWMYDNNEMAFVANVGTLVRSPAWDLSGQTDPYVTAGVRNYFIDPSFVKPPRLYSHNDQQIQMQSSVPDQPYTTGWGGRAADLLNSSYNGSSNVSMNISLNQLNSLQVGGTAGGVTQYIVTNNGARVLRGYGPGNYDNAVASYNADGTPATYEINNNGDRLKGFDRIMRHAHANLLEDGYNQVMERSRDNEAFITLALANGEDAAGTPVDPATIDATFAQGDVAGTGQNFSSNHDLANEMRMVAKLIAGRNCFGNQRQIFFVATGGFDNHQANITNHGLQMERVGHALASFNQTMKDLGLHDKVLTLTQSDFSRTFTPNRDSTDPNTGSDHAYGGTMVAMGGPVAGGKIYGKYPPLLIGNVPNSIDTSTTRGRFIPTTSTDQYLSVAADWFGISNGSSDMEAIFPNLANFANPFEVGDPHNLKWTV